MEPGKLVMTIIVGILLIVVLYYSYKFLYGTTGVDDLIIYQSASGGIPAKVSASDTSNKNVFSGSSVVPYIYPGGEYSISTWIYVTKWDSANNKPFLVLSNGESKSTGFMTLVMYLGKTTNKLGIRMSYGDTKLRWNLLGENGNLVQANNVYADSSSGPSMSSNLSMDVDSIDIQRWVNITTVITGTTVDVYMDGKLARSSLLPSVFIVDSGERPTMTLGHVNGFNGIIGKTRAANVAYSPDKVYTNYQEGPFSSFNLNTLFNSLNPFQYGVTITNNNSILLTTESASN
jgi:hypothetical protein